MSSSFITLKLYKIESTCINGFWAREKKGKQQRLEVSVPGQMGGFCLPCVEG
jgi:hypothetical protein